MSVKSEDDEIIVNGERFSTETAQQGMAVISNSRSASGPARNDLIQRAGAQYNGDRDVWDVLGYDTDIEPEDYRAKYERLDIANRVIELPADDTWREKPEVTDDTEAEQTAFTKDIEKLDQQIQLFHMLRRTDVVSGIGEYGLLLIGLKDGQPLDEPPNEGTLTDPEDVAFMTPFAQDHVEGWTLGKEAEEGEHTEPTDERYNMPVKYRIDFSGYLDESDSEGSDIHEVHWKRLIHVAEGKVETDLRGTPRLQPIYNRLHDYEKVLGSSAEMFWTGAAPRFHFNVDTDSGAQIPSEEIENMDDEVQKFVHEMQTYLKTFDTDVEVIGGEEVDPTGIMDQIVSAIAGQSGIPQRILTGSERGELASSQDRSNWFDRIRTRQHRFAGPSILRPVIDRLVEFGVISDAQDGTYEIIWPNLFELNQLETSELKANRSQTVQQIAPQGDTSLLPGGPENVIEFVNTGEFPEAMKDGTISSPETDQSGNSWYDFSVNAVDFDSGDPVLYNGEEAVINGVNTSDFDWIDDSTIPASNDDPVYIISTMHGVDYAKGSEIEPYDWTDEVQSENPINTVESADLAGNAYELMNEPHDIDNFTLAVNEAPNPGLGFDSWPDTWEKSNQPARLIALKAWAALGGRFTTCRREMMTKMGPSRANRFCAAFKDEILQTEQWRNRF